MSYRNHRSHKDANQGDIVDALVRVGCEVLDLSAVGGGCSDLLVYRKATGLLRLLEVKNPATTLRKDGTPYASKKATHERQQKFALRFPAWKAYTVEEALAAMEIERAA